MHVSSIKKQHLSHGFPFTLYQNSFALCGQPQREDLKEFKKDNWTHVLNLRNLKELQSLEFDMQELCKELGLSYYFIPIMESGALKKESLEQCHKLLKSHPDEKFIIHCASGMRSALVLISHLFFLNKYEKEDLLNLALELGINSSQIFSLLES